MINNSPSAAWAYAAPDMNTRTDWKRQPQANLNFEQNWIQVGTIPLNGTSAVVSNIPTRWLRLEGQSFTATNFYAFIWTSKMSFSY